MKKKLVIIMMLFTIAMGYFLNYGQPTNYLAENDGADDRMIEWNSYREGKVL